MCLKKFVCMSICLIIEECIFVFDDHFLDFVGISGFIVSLRRFHISIVILVLRLKFVCCNL